MSAFFSLSTIIWVKILGYLFFACTSPLSYKSYLLLSNFENETLKVSVSFQNARLRLDIH